jgi:hypothetical protein
MMKYAVGVILSGSVYGLCFGDMHGVTVTASTYEKTAAWEKFVLNGVSARYVRIIGYGNNSDKFGNWININEVDLIPSAP